MKILNLAIAASLIAPFAAYAQTGTHDNIQPRSTNNAAPTQEHWNHDQLLTSTVHQAWLLSGKNEANFFEMVEQLAEISATNRGLTLPTDEAAGRRMGEYIKRASKMDTDQLLYAVVDRAVLVATNSKLKPVSSTTARK